MSQSILPQPVNTFTVDFTEADIPPRPPSAPSNIETLSLSGPRYPGQKLHPDTPSFISPMDEFFISEAHEPESAEESDHPEIWNRVVKLCELLRGLLEQLPDPVEEITANSSNPNGPITSHQLLITGEFFIQSLEPVRPLMPNKLTESALEKNPELKEHVLALEHKFDDIERVLRCLPQVYKEVTKEECDAATIEVEAIMVCLGTGLGVE